MFNLNLANIQTYLIVGAATFVISAGASAWGIAKYKDNHYNAIIAKMESDYKTSLAIETSRVVDTEHKLYAIKSQLELKDIEENEKIKTLLAKYNAAVADGKRLRDPGKQARNCPDPRDPKHPDVDNGSVTGAELSLEANRFLLAEAARADRVLQELKLCKEWAEKTQKEIKQFNKERNVFLD